VFSNSGISNPMYTDICVAYLHLYIRIITAELVKTGVFTLNEVSLSVSVFTSIFTYVGTSVLTLA